MHKTKEQNSLWNLSKTQAIPSTEEQKSLLPSLALCIIFASLLKFQVLSDASDFLHLAQLLYWVAQCHYIIIYYTRPGRIDCKEGTKGSKR